ncbi:hypothetical protein NM208_g5761 [Fusarium decemcellulare]|uniref:Uncharacterized protein n=1 Tax=Fusarium decemcellulare TaxID=57161 RepID=A0ACC1SFS9_9HYPO|nr:hypothetical protein NM208_g5761 [Fusarium decemcellulare]
MKPSQPLTILLLAVSTAEGLTLLQCQAACRAGDESMNRFCRQLPRPELRAACWGGAVGLHFANRVKIPHLLCQLRPTALLCPPSTWTKLATSPSRLSEEQNPPEQPRPFPTKAFSVIVPDQTIEEEKVPAYVADDFYPVRLGQVFEDRFQITTKLGYGTSSTIWLSRDSVDHQHVTLKVYMRTSRSVPELPIYEHFMETLVKTKKAGRNNIRQLLGSFEIDGPDGRHTLLIHKPAQMSLRDMKTVFMPDGFGEDLVKGAMEEGLKALDFLQGYAQVVHTGKSYAKLS